MGVRRTLYGVHTYVRHTLYAVQFTVKLSTILIHIEVHSILSYYIRLTLLHINIHALNTHKYIVFSLIIIMIILII